jgi:hypothetical protein
MKNGKKNWVFCDGDLPPAGDNKDFPGHEALMITNISKKDASIRINIIFEDKAPYTDITIDLKAMRTTCLRLDKPIGKEGYKIPFGQYAIHVVSNVPVCACFGRLDVRQTNMAYYSPAGYSF